MSTLTLTFFEALQAAGVPDEKARATVESLDSVTEKQRTSLDNVIEKQRVDLSRELATKADLERVRAEMTRIEANLIKWLVGVGIGAVITLYGLLKVSA